MLRYRPRTFGLELAMLAVGLLFLYPVYVLVRSSSFDEVAATTPGAWKRRAPRRGDAQLDDHHRRSA